MEINEKILSEKSHWNKIHKSNQKLSNYFSNFTLFRSYYHYALFKIISRFSGRVYKNVIEIGCAPGNYLVKFKKILYLNPFGVEYSKEGYQKTINNVSSYGIPKDNIFFDDFLNPEFLSKNNSNYDIVFSAGFIEHFKNPKEIIDKQIGILKANGLLICLIPNKKYLNKFFTSKESLLIHNLEIMEKNDFREIFINPGIEVLYCNYFGGFLNIGLYQPRGLMMKTFFYVFFILQRLLIDNFLKFLFVFTEKDLVSRYTSPALICIARKLS